MATIVKNIEYDEFYLTLFRVLKLIDSFKDEKLELNEKRIAMFDFYLKYPFMVCKTKETNSFDELYSYYFWKPNFLLYDAVLTTLLSRDLINLNEKNYSIGEKGEAFINTINSDYLNKLNDTIKYIISTLSKLSDKKINDDIIKKSQRMLEV